jgi:malate dehydrogenase
MGGKLIDCSFVTALIRAVQGESDIREETYVYLPGVPGGQAIAISLGVDYFAVPVDLGKEGVTQAYPIGLLSEYEQILLTKAISDLKADIGKGINFAQEG